MSVLSTRYKTIIKALQPRGGCEHRHISYYIIYVDHIAYLLAHWIMVKRQQLNS